MEKLMNWKICVEVQDIKSDLLQQIAQDILAEEKQSVLIYK